MNQDATHLVEKRKLAVVLPVFNDWTSCIQLLAELDELAGKMSELSFELIIVDDGSTEEFSPQVFENHALRHTAAIRVLELECNMGHQRAIAIGLYEAAKGDYSLVAIMDCDGEDRPEDLQRLLEHHQAANVPIVVAARSKRSEGFVFEVFYALYRTLFKVLTGETIRFGNFSVLSPGAVRRLIHMPELWNNFPAATLKSRLELDSLPARRGLRFSGSSRMGISGLITHGLSAISVASERIFARVMIFSAVLGLATVAVALMLVWLRLTMHVSVPGPGWTSMAIGILTVIFSQIFIFFLLSIFLLLQARSNPALATSDIAERYVRRIIEIDLYDSART